MSEPTIYELRRRKAIRMCAQGFLSEAERDAIITKANADEQEEIRTLQNAIRQTRLNR